MQAALGKWLGGANLAPIVVLRWNPATGQHVRRTDKELPELRSLALELATAQTETELSSRLRRLLDRVAF
jgi:hypothetical protein